MPTYEGYDVDGSEQADLIYAIGDPLQAGTNYSVRGNGGSDKIYAPARGSGTFPTGTQSIDGGSGDDSIYMRSTSSQPWTGLSIDGGDGFDRLFLKAVAQPHWSHEFNYGASSITGIEYINFEHDLSMKIGDLVGADGRSKATLVASGDADELTFALDNRTDIDLSKFLVRGFDADTGRLQVTGWNNITGSHADLFTGSRYSDYFISSNANAKLYGGLGNDDLQGGTVLSGGDGDDRLYGTTISPASGFIMRGGEGNDTLTWLAGTKGFADGGNGDDTYVGPWTSDIWLMERAGGGTDTVRTSKDFTLPEHFENLVLTAGNSIRGTGNAVDNVISADDRNLPPNTSSGVVIDGKEGNDTLTGFNYDSDIFVFSTALGADNVDTITWMKVGGTGWDKIALDHTIFTELSVGKLPGTAFYVGPAAHDADDRIIQYNGTLYYDPDGTGTAEQVAFAHIGQTTGALTQYNFIII